MSTDYDVWCVTCERALDLNQGRRVGCGTLIAAARWLQRFAVAAADPPSVPEEHRNESIRYYGPYGSDGFAIEITLHRYQSFNLLWFVTHGQHELTIRDEYGNVEPSLQSLPVLSPEEIEIEARIRAAVLAERAACKADMLAAADAAADGRP